MGMRYVKHKASRKRPWPRYRLSIWGIVSLVWVDLPQLYYSPETVIKAGRGRVETFGEKVRVCAMGRKKNVDAYVDMSLEDFEKQHGKKG